MKGRAIYKTIQLIIFVVIAVGCIFLIFSQTDVFHQVAADKNMKILCITLWGVFVISFIFIYLDFRFFMKYRKDYREMSIAVNSDPTTGIGNRHSCDVMIEKYMESGLPADLGCIMIDLTDVSDINAKYGHQAGNILLRDFSAILRSAAPKDAFLARNGGNRFLVVIDPCTDADMNAFLGAISAGVTVYNSSNVSYQIRYSSGSAFHEGDAVRDMAGLVALATKRITAQ